MVSHQKPNIRILPRVNHDVLVFKLDLPISPNRVISFGIGYFGTPASKRADLSPQHKAFFAALVATYGVVGGTATNDELLVERGHAVSWAKVKPQIIDLILQHFYPDFCPGNCFDLIQISNQQISFQSPKSVKTRPKKLLAEAERRIINESLRVSDPRQTGKNKSGVRLLNIEYCFYSSGSS